MYKCVQGKIFLRLLYTYNSVTFYVYTAYFVHKYRDFLKCTLCRHAVAFQEQREGFAVVRCRQ